MEKTTYYSECDCGQILEGAGQYDPADGTLYADDNCPKCGEEFIVSGWFDECEECLGFHEEGDC